MRSDSEPPGEAPASVASSRPPFSFRYLLGGNWLAYGSYGVLIAVLPLAELSEGGGPILATLVLGAPLLAQTLAAWGWGWLGDRTGSRRGPLVLAALLQAPLFATFPLLGPLALFGVRIVQSALFGSVVLATTLATEDPNASSAFRLGRLQLAQNGGMLLGVVVSFPLLVGSGFRLDSLAGWGLSAVLAVFTVLSAVLFAAAGALPRREVTPSVFQPASHPKVFRLAEATAVVSTARYMVVAAVPVYLASTLGRSGFFGLSANPTEQLAVWVAISSALNIVASPFSGRWAETSAVRRRSLLAFSVVYAAIWFLIAAAPTYGVTFGVWILPVAVFFTVAGVREAAQLSGPAERGRAVGLVTAAFNLGGLLGGAAAGVLLAEGFPVPTVFLIAAFGSVAGALLFVPGAVAANGRTEELRTSGS